MGRGSFYINKTAASHTGHHLVISRDLSLRLASPSFRGTTLHHRARMVGFRVPNVYLGLIMVGDPLMLLLLVLFSGILL
jgi:hypothetical protein